MVRIMVGTLVEVGLGRYAPEEIPKMLAARDRRAAGSTAPPHGLYLQWIRFAPSDVPAADGEPAADSVEVAPPDPASGAEVAGGENR
jgi:tRNA U38,U39,U40 pseudouridine synthase TruA